MRDGKGERERENGKVGKVKERAKSKDGWEIRVRAEGKTVTVSDNLSLHLAHDLYVILTKRKWLLSN